MRRFPYCVALSLLFVTGCSAAAAAATPAPGLRQQPLLLTSKAFKPGAAIPIQYTCQGENISPHLAWSGAPQGTQSFALILDDPDAPSGTFVHWVVYNLPADTSELPEGASTAKTPFANLPKGAAQGKTGFNRVGYGGPCPPSGTHRYFFHLYALDTTFTNLSMDKPALLKAMAGHILAQGELMGTFKK